MLIRSQDKTILMNCDFFSVEENGDKYEVITLSSKNGIKISLGIYTTKGKALEVLSDIQEYYKRPCCEAFRMPYDEDVEI